ncbi:PREDICTED: dyslexia-associated protein KIAA0319-like isoform X1 [Poecilia mexicana]|uniref:dyslexia-associated protein KIAA0319-like isoform X1 n=1 Tax=Poecilia mexicana TaxID=48701 RepID=UPI00072EC6A4|nr:PREDICTED: dyslexia-associated protein KIAA0319-like isoform X1 [Poecilia mexicana]
MVLVLVPHPHEDYWDVLFCRNGPEVGQVILPWDDSFLFAPPGCAEWFWLWTTSELGPGEPGRTGRRVLLLPVGQRSVTRCGSPTGARAPAAVLQLGGAKGALSSSVVLKLHFRPDQVLLQWKLIFKHNFSPIMSHCGATEPFYVAADPHSATRWRITVLLLLLHIMEAAVAPPCWQGATFPEAVVSPAADSSGIVRVPAAASLQRCVAACCDLPDCDLAWRFKGRCYVLSCQQGADCRPQVRPGADSVLAFLQRPARSRLQSLGRPAPFDQTRGPGGDLEALRGPALFDGPDPTWSDPADLEADWFWDAFNQSQEADPGGAESDSNLTGTRTAGQEERTRTTEPAGPAAAEGTAGSQRPELPPSAAPVTDSAPTGHMTMPGDIISTTVSPAGHPIGDLVYPVDLGAAVTSEPTDSSEAGNRTSEPLKVLQAPTTDPLIQVTSDLSSSAALPPTAAAEPQGPNRAPLAAVGPDLRLVLPLNASLLLNGSGSTDDRGVSGYSWEVVSGPPGLQLQDADRAVAMATGLRVGRYAFKLTVSDQQGATDSALLSVRVQEARSLPPVAHASGSHVLVLPNSSVVLEGSVTDGDQTEVQYRWTRDSQSPAAGEVLFGSETRRVLYLSDLVEGTYLFQLRVTDAQGRVSTATATVEVRPEPGGGQQVELEMLVAVSQVSVAQRDTLVRQLAALIHVLDRDIRVRALQGRTQLSTVLQFWVQGPTGPVPASSLVVLLRKQLLRDKSDFLLFKVLRVDTVACELSCSGRGQCDPITKQCSCDPFWTENLIRLYLGDGESNCEWRVLFVILSSFLTMVLILSLSWTFVCCSRRRKQSKGRKKTRYTILDDMDEQERLELRPRFSLKHRSTEHNSSLMMSESELDSDQDSVFSRPVRNRNRVSSQAARNGNAFG